MTDLSIWSGSSPGISPTTPYISWAGQHEFQNEVDFWGLVRFHNTVTVNAQLTANGLILANAGLTIANSQKLNLPSNGDNTNPEVKWGTNEGIAMNSSPGNMFLSVSSSSALFRFFVAGTTLQDITTDGLRLYRGLILGQTSTGTNMTLATTSPSVICVSSTSSPRTITLPNSTTGGRIYIIKDTSGGASANNITIARAGSMTIDGATSILINTDYGVRVLVCNGSNWSVII